MKLSIETKGLRPFITEQELSALQPLALDAHKVLMSGSGKGNDFLGWRELPSNSADSLTNAIVSCAARLSGISEVCVVIGIGGSYLGARAVIEALKHTYSSMLEDREFPEIVYAGHHLSADQHSDLIDLLDQKEYSLIVISKSGTTTEPAVAFRLLKAHLENKYGTAAARERIVAITDREKGVLKKLADSEGYESYIVPDDVGGRFSVLTPVGLLPIAVAGFDIKLLLQGARSMQQALKDADGMSNPAIAYACARNACYNKGFLTEVLVNYEPRLTYLTEWWKQLYGESEGKEGKGIFPAGVSFTTDLHSMGQYLQEGKRHIFESMLRVGKPQRELKVPVDPADADGLNFIAGKGLSEVNEQAARGTYLAHHDGGVPIIGIDIPEINEEVLGQLLYFFEFACAISGYMLGVNPFDQPGVEAYKKNMFALLGKPGFEDLAAKLKKQIS
jgi:glucose-6-phosphate isomerase